MDMTKLQEFHSLLCSSSSSTSSLSNSHPIDVGAEEWAIAESRVHEILSMIQPTVLSERRRKEIIEYIQILIGSAYAIKVFPFGSVPLKTYLPDGDIDLSALCNYDEEVVSSIFCSLLQNEATMNPHIQVRNVQHVPAQVRVVKCYVEDIAVDISFNQKDGLCALTFIEQVDQLIGKDHLFKRSIILIKAWCFYESRILGAHNGLISTYALETMIAHIINLFHSSLRSPLAVLYKFLGYYNKFDWEYHLVAINGLVPISSLPLVVVQPPDESDDALLNDEFLQKCKKAYSFSTGINQTGGYPFCVRFLNVVDPLRDNNNIGRSVNKANFNRIKFALSFATEKLNAILISPLREEIANGIETFFKTTIAKNGSGKRPDAPMPELSHRRSEVSEKLSHDSENLLAGIQYGLWLHEFGIYQGCNDRLFPEMWNKCNLLGLEGHCDLYTLFQVYESSAPHPFLDSANFSGVIAKSRGTGTYIPQTVYNERMPFRQSNRRTHSPRPSTPLEEDLCTEGIESMWSPEDGISNCVNMSLAEFPPLAGTSLTSPYLASEKTTDNWSLKAEHPTTQTSHELGLKPNPNPIKGTEAEEEEMKMVRVDQLFIPPVSEEFPDLPRTRQGGKSKKGASGRN